MTGADDRIRVAFADDHPLYRDALRELLASVPAIDLVGEAADGADAVELVRALDPDVLLLDLEMPAGGGLEALRRIQALGRHTAVVVLTMHEDDASLSGAIRAGARGYLPKTADRGELATTITLCAAGGTVLGSHLAGRLAALVGREGAAATAFPDLTQRERDVLDRLARGERNEGIARHLGLSGKTVRNHVSTILNKLGVADRAAAIVRAREAGVGRDDETPG